MSYAAALAEMRQTATAVAAAPSADLAAIGSALTQAIVALESEFARLCVHANSDSFITPKTLLANTFG